MIATKIQRSFTTMMNGQLNYYYVRLTYSVWPAIYGDERPIYFPTEKSARKFAENNISKDIIRARVFDPRDNLLVTFE